MATITNRSRYVVQVEGHPQLTREFPFTKKKAARSYLEELRRAGYTSARLTQRENALLVRIRQKGYPELTFQVSSYEEADLHIKRIEAERRQGLFRDYSLARKVTHAQLFDRYIDEECPRHKGGEIETYTLEGFLADCGYDSERVRRRRERRLAMGKNPRKSHRRRKPRKCIEWLHKPFANVLPTDIERYVSSRLAQGIQPATVDRELDLIAQVVNWAIKTLRIPISETESPMYGVRRPRYSNARDRRLRGTEEQRLLEAARVEDQIRSRKLAIEAMIKRARSEAAGLPNRTARKRHIARAKIAASAELGDSYPVIPLFEALITFLLFTAARRSEALALTWSNTYLDERRVFFPDTKNGTARNAPLRQHLVSLLSRLPRNHPRVFPISLDTLKGAWRRICSRARIKDLHIHDLRHEAISRIAEAGFASGRPFDLITLAAITGHRDIRMLARYSHMCVGLLAERLDEAFELAEQKRRLPIGHPAATGKMSSDTTAPAVLA